MLKPKHNIKALPKKRAPITSKERYSRLIMGAFDSDRGKSFWKKVRRGQHKTIDCPTDQLHADGSVENYLKDAHVTHIMCDDLFIKNHFLSFDHFTDSIETVYKPILFIETDPNEFSQDSHDHIFLIHID